MDAKPRQPPGTEDNERRLRTDHSALVCEQENLQNAMMVFSLRVRTV